MYINATDEIEKKWESNRRRAVRLTVEIGNSGEITVEGQENLRLRLETVGK